MRSHFSHPSPSRTGNAFSDVPVVLSVEKVFSLCHDGTGAVASVDDILCLVDQFSGWRTQPLTKFTTLSLTPTKKRHVKFYNGGIQCGCALRAPESLRENSTRLSHLSCVSS